MHRFSLALVLLASSAAAAAGPSSFWGSKKLSAIHVSAKTLGKGWDGPAGLVLDELADADKATKKMPDDERGMVMTLVSALQPSGITACGDFIYTKAAAGPGGDHVTVRIFVFQDNATASKWWRDKYEDQRVQHLYRKNQRSQFQSVDSLETSKRIVLAENWLISSQQDRPGKEYLTALDAFLAKIKPSR
jgi:hypothetical protein